MLWRGEQYGKSDADPEINFRWARCVGGGLETYSSLNRPKGGWGIGERVLFLEAPYCEIRKFE